MVKWGHMKPKKGAPTEEIKKYNAERYKSRKEWYRVYGLKYYQEHKEAMNEYSRKYSKAHPPNKEQSRKKEFKKYQKNREQMLARNSIYAKANPDIMRARGARRYARKVGAIGRGITGEERKILKEEYFYRCAYCNNIAPLEIDHITPLIKGGRHEIENSVPACKSCNTSKGAKPLLIWMYERNAHG